jgi:hypothetical protein
LDPLLEFLLNRASVTQIQFETMVLSKEEGRLGKKASLRKGGPVSKGSFWRTLRQARSNVESSVYTVLLMSYAGLIPSGKLNQLARVASLVQEIRKQDLGKEDLARVERAAEEFVQEFSGRAKGYL